jgi:hypothetical protein
MLLQRFLAPVFAVGLLAVAADANAGSLVVRDEAQIFTPGDTEQLRAIVAKAPFDARLVTTSNYVDQPGFSRFVGTMVSEPNMVVLGIDPQHHHVQVHFGTGSHIPQADWPAIERAGNDAFKRTAWEEGGADVFRAAATAVTSGAGVVTPATSPAGASAGSFLVVGLIAVLVIGIVLAAILFAVFRRRSPGFGAVPYGGGAGPYPGGGGPYYGPGGTRGAMGPLGGGLIGAGLGGIAGYELGKMEGEHEQRGYDQGGYGGGGGGSSTPDNGSFDAGGGGSSWDDSGSSGGGGGDFGGGGGDFGGGGGGDSGGGGSDF